MFLNLWSLTMMALQSIDSMMHPPLEAVKLGLRQLFQECDGERIQLATSLHKDVAGVLVASTSVVEVIRSSIEQLQGSTTSLQLLSQLDATLRQALQSVRELTEAQFPPVLKAFGLKVALQQYLRGLAGKPGRSIILHTEGEEPQFDLRQRLNLFRIIQSILSLCIANESTTWLELTCRSEAELLEIGLSFDGFDDFWGRQEASAELAVIAARCDAINCQLRTRSRGSPGTSTITLTVSALTMGDPVPQISNP